MAGIICVYGLVVSVLISQNVTDTDYAPFSGFVHLAAGLATGFCGLAAGYAIGMFNLYQKG
jgi:V-type H+-transporting ATPase proteolipid subunit